MSDKILVVEGNNTIADFFELTIFMSPLHQKPQLWLHPLTTNADPSKYIDYQEMGEIYWQRA